MQTAHCPQLAQRKELHGRALIVLFALQKHTTPSGKIFFDHVSHFIFTTLARSQFKFITSIKVIFNFTFVTASNEY